jgi:hypothetical protein
MKCVIFKHPFSFLSMFESVIASIPTRHLYNRSFTLFQSKARLLHNNLCILTIMG